MSKVISYDIYLYEKRIGSLASLPGDKNFFFFEQNYIEDADRDILSLSFQDTLGELITAVKPTQTRVPPFFANLLPEEPMRSFLAKRAGVGAIREFHLLGALGADLAGAITIKLSNNNRARDEESMYSTKKKGQIKNEGRPLRFSLAGVQLKFSAIKKTENNFTIPMMGDGGSWIVKLPSLNFKYLTENEYSMMMLAKASGIDVPEVQLIPIKNIEGIPSEIQLLGDYAFVIKRFDRESQDEKIHIEDFAQVFAVYPEEKYKKASYRNIVEVLNKIAGKDAIVEFIRRIVFNTLIGNGDMHLKNWSLIYPDRKNAELSPAYDFVSTIPYIPNDKHALKFLNTKEFASLDIELFKSFAIKAQLSQTAVVETVKETVERFSQAWKTISELPLHSDHYSIINRHLQTLRLYR